MHNVAKLISENRVEIYNFIKSQGGFINFATNNQDECLDDDWDGDFDDCREIVPWLALSGCDYLVDAAILAVKCGQEETHTIDILVYDNNTEDIYWDDTSDCIGYNEQVLYDQIGGLMQN